MKSEINMIKVNKLVDKSEDIYPGVISTLERGKAMKKAIAIVMSIVMLIIAVPVWASDYTEVFSAGENEQSDFSDAAVQEEIFGDGEDEPAYIEETPFDANVLSAQSMYDVSVTGTMVRSEIQEFVRLLNQEREAMGRPPVRLDQEMMEIAQARAAEGSLLYNHFRPDGSSGFQWWDEAAQLTATRDSNAAYLLQRWKESTAHWEGLTGSKDTRFGLGIFDQGTGVCSVFACIMSDATQAGHPYMPYTGTLSDTTETYTFRAGNQYIDFASGESYNLQVSTTIAIRPKYYIWFAYDSDYFGYFNNNNGTWVSDNPSVATIDAQGNLSALKAGDTKVHFFLNGDKDKSYDLNVTVSGSQLPVTIKGNFIYRGSEKLYGWVTDGDDKYYTDPSTGVIQQGFTEIEGNKYFFVPVFFDEYTIGGTQEIFAACTMLKDVTVTINGQWYQFFMDGTFEMLDSQPTPAPVNPTPTPIEPSPTPTPDVAEVTAPTAPKLRASASGKTVKLNWNVSKGTSGYQIYRYDSKTKAYKRFKTIAKGTINSFSYKPGLNKTDTLKIRAYAMKKDGKSRLYGKFSSTVKVKTAPGKTAITKAVSREKGQVTLQWKKTAGAEGYQIYRATSKSGKYSRIKTITKGTTLAYTNSKLASGKMYYYKIRAYRTNGKTRIYGGFSSVKGVKAR